VTVFVFPPPLACAPPIDICLNQTGQLDAASCSQGLAYAWFPDPTLNPLNVPNPIASPTVTTTYSFTVTNGNCPPDTASVTVTVHSIPLVTACPDTTILAGVSVQLTSSGNGTRTWSPDTWLTPVSGSDPIATPWLTTTYIVTTVDSNGCRNADTVTIYVDDILTLYVPTAFTPFTYSNNNSVFYAYGVGVWEFEFYIFDRWGTLMFKTNDIYTGWDGTYNGKMVQSDVYVWLAKARSITGKSITKTGPVTVVR
jgi:gliding motility-associated-like protein